MLCSDDMNEICSHQCYNNTCIIIYACVVSYLHSTSLVEKPYYHRYTTIKPLHFSLMTEFHRQRRNLRNHLVIFIDRIILVYATAALAHRIICDAVCIVRFVCGVVCVVCGFVFLVCVSFGRGWSHVSYLRGRHGGHSGVGGGGTRAG